ncbi:MAG: hypothetical protein Q8L10_03355 [Candidatus Moranbacteria bacterium]|nr:hypothetical protein [Candidatus Moranbacteria bacterium]
MKKLVVLCGISWTLSTILSVGIFQMSAGVDPAEIFEPARLLFWAGVEIGIDPLTLFLSVDLLAVLSTCICGIMLHVKKIGYNKED